MTSSFELATTVTGGRSRDRVLDAGFNVPGLTRMAFELDKEGYIGLPPGPGLGVEVDEEKLAAEAKKPQTYRWPGAKLKDGSVADY